VREPVAPRVGVAGRAQGRVRRAVVAGVGEQPGEQDGEDDVARRLGVRAAAGARPQQQDDERARVTVRRRGAPPQPRVAPGM
jgi:hypothetical protein